MSELIIAALRGTQLRSTAVAVRATYDDRLRQLEQQLKTLKDQAGALADIAFNADFALVAGDGTKIPARKQMLCAKSSFFKRMMEHGDSAEARAGEVIAKTGDGKGASAAALRHLMTVLYGQQGLASADSAVLLEICDLATLWEFDSVLEAMPAILVASAKASAKTACEMLVAARRHTEADDRSEVWKRLREAAAKGVAEAGHNLMGVSAFAELDITAICEVMTHVKTDIFKLPSVEVDTESERWMAGEDIDGLPTDQDLSWLLGATGAKIVVTKGHLGSVLVTTRTTGRKVGVRCMWRLQCPHQPDIVKAHTHVLGSHFVNAISVSSSLRATKFVCSATIQVLQSQRQYELFNLWLLATKIAARPLSPVDSLLCLRACATGCDIDGASVSDLQAMLTQRGLSTSGAKSSLQLRLRDAAYAEVPADSAAAKATKAFAELVARHYGSGANVKDLDAASVRCFGSAKHQLACSHDCAHSCCACVHAACGCTELRSAAYVQRGDHHGQYHQLGAARRTHRRGHRKSHAARALAARVARAAEGAAQGAHEALPSGQGAGGGGDRTSDEARLRAQLHAKEAPAHGRQRGHGRAEAQEAEALPRRHGAGPRCVCPRGSHDVSLGLLQRHVRSAEDNASGVFAT